MDVTFTISCSRFTQNEFTFTNVLMSRVHFLFLIIVVKGRKRKIVYFKSYMDENCRIFDYLILHYFTKDINIVTEYLMTNTDY